MQQFQEKQLSGGTGAEKARDSEEQDEMENRLELERQEMEAKFVQEQHEMVKNIEEKNKRECTSLPVENAIDESYLCKERLRQIEHDKKAIERSIDLLQGHVYEEIDDYKKGASESKRTKSSLDRPNCRREEENMKLSAKKLNDLPATSNTFQYESDPDKIHNNNRNNVQDCLPMRTMNSCKEEVEQMQGGTDLGFIKEHPSLPSDPNIHADKKSGLKQSKKTTTFI